MLERLQASSLTPSDSTKLINHLARSQTDRRYPHITGSPVGSPVGSVLAAWF